MKRKMSSASLFKKDIQSLTKEELKKAIVLNEVLSKPIALRPKR